MISFYPGPSRVHDKIPDWVREAHRQGILSMNHRSQEFMDLVKKTSSLLKEKLDIPESYSIFFTSSATECWEIIAQSLLIKKSVHVYNGAFGQKWFDYTHRLVPDAQAIPFGPQNELAANELVFRDTEAICITQNETSNGTQVSNKIIYGIRKVNPDVLLAVDATSSMGGIHLKFEAADCWFASVQKCFGLPAGLAVMVCSPRAVQRLEQIAESKHYNSLTTMKEMMDHWQTTHTPNVLAIYLLKCVVKSMSKIRRVEKKTLRRQKDWERYFRKSRSLRLFAGNTAVRSSTVITIQGSPDLVETIKAAGRKKGFLLGDGYGDLKRDTFRIANFPALRKKEIEKLRSFLTTYI